MSWLSYFLRVDTLICIAFEVVVSKPAGSSILRWRLNFLFCSHHVPAKYSPGKRKKRHLLYLFSCEAIGRVRGPYCVASREYFVGLTSLSFFCILPVPENKISLYPSPKISSGEGNLWGIPTFFSGTLGNILRAESQPLGPAIWARPISNLPGMQEWVSLVIWVLVDLNDKIRQPVSWQHMNLLITDVPVGFFHRCFTLIFQIFDPKDMISKHSQWTEAYEFRMQLDSDSLWLWRLHLVQGTQEQLLKCCALAFISWNVAQPG